MYVVKVDDGFVEWAFELEGSDGYSIQNLVDVICKNTNLQVVKSAQQNMHWTAGIVRRFKQFSVVKFILSLWHSLASRQ